MQLGYLLEIPAFLSVEAMMMGFRGEKRWSTHL